MMMKTRNRIRGVMILITMILILWIQTILIPMVMMVVVMGTLQFLTLMRML